MMVSGLKNSITSVLSGAKLRMPLIDSCSAKGCVSMAEAYAERHTEVQVARHPALGEAHLVNAAHCTDVRVPIAHISIQLRSALLCLMQRRDAFMQGNVQLRKACCLLGMLCCSHAHVPCWHLWQVLHIEVDAVMRRLAGKEACPFTYINVLLAVHTAT